MAHCAPIMVAEDEESDVLLLQIAFERAGLPTELVVARDGQEVIDYLCPENSSPGQFSRPKPGLLLLDLKMPRMDGFEVLEWLAGRPEFKDLPVVVLSSSTLEEDVEKARQLGAREYLVKPHGIHSLVGMLQQVHSRYFCPSAVTSGESV